VRIDQLVRCRVAVPVIVGLSVFLSGVWIGTTTAAAATPSSGLVCATDSQNTFSLTAQSDYISTPDGNQVFMWGYGLAGGGYQYPGPVLCVDSGASVTISLKNTLAEDTSLVFPGVDAVLANGQDSQPVLDGSGHISSLAPVAAANGGSMTYTFTAAKPGTYIYETGTDQAKQREMGMYGVIVVRPSGHPSQAYDDAGTTFKPDTEFLLLLSQVDPAVHSAVEAGGTYNLSNNHPRYYFTNGRSFPDTIDPNDAASLPNQPYSSLVHIVAQPHDTVGNPGAADHFAPALIRYVNMGPHPYPFHPHGQDGRVVGRDGEPIVTSGNDQSYLKFSVDVGQGQTEDVLYDFTDEEGYNPTTNPVPVQLPPLQDLLFKDAATYYSGSPYLGVQDDMPVGTTSYNQCGEYYHVMHSHDLHQVTNYGAAMGGMLTLMRIDPADTSAGATPGTSKAGC
jgi:FtsP/CotA-like multicopper oxidase with cupredoxin domain